MAKNTTVSLGDHFEEFIESQVRSGRFASASEVVRASLRLLEMREHHLVALRGALDAGEASGSAGPLNIEGIKGKARGISTR